jgi:predicted MFS family arabinose efflux permease
VIARAARRDFRLLWTGETASRFGSSVTGLAVPLVAVQTLHASTFTVAVVAASAWLPWLVIGLPAGALVDRWPRRWIMLGCDAVSIAVLVSVPVAAWLGTLTIGHLLVATTLAGVANVFFQTSYTSYVPTVVGQGDLAEANARLQSSESAAQVAGPGLAGLLTQLFGAVTGLLADAVSFAVSAVCLLRIRVREEPAVRTTSRRSLRREIAAGVRFVAGDRYLRVFTVYGAVSNLLLMGYQAILVVFLIRTVGVSPGVVGVLTALTLLGGVAGAALAPRIVRRFGSARGLLLSEGLGMPFALLIPLTGRGPLLVCFVAGSAVLIGGVLAGNVISATFRQAYIPLRMLGRAITSMQFVKYGTIPLGALLGGALGTALGLRPAMWVLTGCLAASAAILLIGPLRGRRDLPTRPDTEKPAPEAVAA